MDYGFSEAQELLRASVKEFMVNEAPLAHVREMEENSTGFAPGLWRKLAQLDWIGLDYPEKYAGLDGSFLDVAVVMEEMGRALFPSPYFASAILGGHTVLAAGNDNQKEDLLPKVVRGETILTLALTEPSGSYEASGVETTATAASGGGHVLNGTKLLVPFAHVADRLIVVARSDGQGTAETSISLFLVDPKAAGVTITPLRIISGEKQSEVGLQNVKVAAADLLGTLGGGWPVVGDVLDKAKVAMSAEMVGGSQAALEMTLNYVKNRIQFGGPIGRFQAIQHRLADLATDIESARWLAYEAAWEISEGQPASAAASMAKAFISDVYVRMGRAAVQFHGGYGYMKEFDVQFYFRRAKASEAILGDQYANRELAAQQMGL
ncbi:MAG: acyl-CoA/acyl-ACP dehydrogenase [Chloroflexi bacterium]|nr:acyl-CoA/acyl-ACP dehydrogenase [Chloroflexota bacterium]